MKTISCPALVIAALLTATLLSIAETPHTAITSTAEPAVSLKDALRLAEQYVADKPITVTTHYLESITLVPRTGSGAFRKLWLVTWAPKTPSDGGPIFVWVEMDKSVTMTGGR